MCPPQNTSIAFFFVRNVFWRISRPSCYVYPQSVCPTFLALTEEIELIDLVAEALLEAQNELENFEETFEEEYVEALEEEIINIGEWADFRAAFEGVQNPGRPFHYFRAPNSSVLIKFVAWRILTL